MYVPLVIQTTMASLNDGGAQISKVLKLGHYVAAEIL